MKKLSVSILMAILAITTVQAQRGHHKMKKSPELRAAIQQHFETEVAPVLKQKQAAFDKQLTSADLQFIQTKRGEAAALLEKHQAQRKAMKEARKNSSDKEAFRENIRAERKEMRQAKKAIAESLSDFMTRNQSLLESTLEDLKPYHEQWHQDRKEIFEAHRPEDAPPRKDMENRSPQDDDAIEDGQKRRKGHGNKRGHKKGGDKKHKAAIKFLLWDGQAPGADLRSGDVDALLPDLRQNYPNPAATTTLIEFTLPRAASEVVLTITDAKGKRVKQQTINQLNKGQHQLEIDVANWPNSTYFYTIEAGTYRTTKKMVVAR